MGNVVRNIRRYGPVIYYSVLTMVLCVLMILVGSRKGPEWVEYDTPVDTLRFEGEWSEDGSTWEPMEQLEKAEKKKYSQIFLRGHFNQAVSEDENLFLSLYQIRVRMFLDDTMIYSYGYSDTDGREQQVSERVWDRVEGVAITPEDFVTIHITPVKDKFYKTSITGMLKSIYAGNEKEILYQQVRQNLPKIILCIVTAALGILLLLLTAVTKLWREELRSGYLSCALLLLSGAVCAFIDYQYVTLMFHNVYMIVFIDYLSQLMICFFLMKYLKIYLHSERSISIVTWCIRLWYGTIVTYCLIYSRHLDLNRGWIELFAVIVLAFISIEIILIIRDYHSYRDENIKYVFISSMVLAAMTAAEVIHYFITNEFWIYVFQIGLLLFTIMQVVSLVSFTIENLQRIERQETALMNSRISIMLSQIQPHFLYNALLVIQNLCHGKAPEAEQATIEFSQFLRGNLDSMAVKNTISF